MLFTVIPWAATSFASVRAKPVSPARKLFDNIRFSTGCFTAIEVMLRMRPQRRSFMPGRTCRANSIALKRVSRIASSHCSRVICSNVPAGGPPALVTRMSIRPNRSLPASTTRLIWFASVTSAGTARTCAPVLSAIVAATSANVCCSRAQITSDAPSAANSSATARPSPRLPAAIRAVLFFSPRSTLLLPQIIVRLVEPVQSWWTEDVDVESVLERFRFVLDHRRNVQHFTRHHVDHLRLVFANPESQAALEDVSELLVLMRMPRHERALFHVDVGQHHSIGGNQSPLKHVAELFPGHIFPAVEGNVACGHGHRLHESV